jgi:hypothetical protein
LIVLLSKNKILIEKMKNKKTELKRFEVVCDIQREENSLCSDLSQGSNKDKIGWPVAHYIGANYNFEGEDSKIQNVLGLAGYFPVAHKDFNDFYGSLKGGKDDYLKFKSLEKRLIRDFDACDSSTSKDVIICPLDSYYKSLDRERIDLDKIEKEELILDSIGLAKNLNKKGLKNKVNLIVYDSALYDMEDLKLREVDGSLNEFEENAEYFSKLKKIEEKYGLTFLEKIDLPYPFLLYEHLRNLNTDLFG